MLSCCRDQIQEVIFFLGESAGAPWKTELLWTDGTGFLGWEIVARLNTARFHEATDAVLEKTCFCCSLSTDQNRGRSKSRVPQPTGRMHSAGGEAATLASSRGHTQHLSIVLVCTAVLGGLPPESFPDTLCYTLKVDGLDTGSGVDRMLAWENMQTTQEESLVVTERLPSPAPCGRTEAAMGPCLDWTRELSLVSYCLSRLPGTRKEDVACIETQVLFLNNTSLRKEEKPTEKWGPPTDETDRCYFS